MKSLSRKINIIQKIKKSHNITYLLFILLCATLDIYNIKGAIADHVKHSDHHIELTNLLNLSFLKQPYLSKSLANYNTKTINNKPKSLVENTLYDTEELLLALYVNKVPRDHVDIVLKRNNELYLSEQSVKKLNFKTKDYANNKIKYYNKNYYRITANKNITYSIRATTSILDIYAPPDAFYSTIIEPEQLWHEPKTPGIGGYINYDLIYKHTREPKTYGLDGIINTTVFYHENILSSDFKTSYIKNKSNTLNFIADNKKLTRLETKYIQDFPDKMITLTIGDTRTFADLWGSPLLIGGVQLATNFTLQPGFVYFPLPDITGEASIPSAIDLYINDVNRQVKNVQDGPFEVLDIPSISGGGEIKVIQKDLLGREKVYTVPYYLSSFSLKTGVKQFSVSAGLLRENFGLSSNQYRDLVVTGNYREGLSKYFTYGLRGEIKQKLFAFGLRTTLTRPKWGEINFVAVGSSQNQNLSGPGALFKAIYINQFKYFNLNITADTMTRKFMTIGDQESQLPHRISLQTFIGLPLKHNNSLSLNYITKDNRNNPSENLLSLNYNHNIKNFLNLNVTSQVDFNNLDRKVVFINLTKPFPSRAITTSLSTNVENNEKTRYIFNLNKNIEDYTGYGYHVRVSKKESFDVLADIKYSSEYNSLQAEYNRLGNENNFRFSARGGIAYLDNNLFVTRTIRDSFVIVDTNEIPNVNIYHNNRNITSSNTNGRAIIPQLNSYNINQINIDPSELPLNTKFDITSQDVIPYRYSGSLLKLRIAQNNSVIFRLIAKNKQPLDTGAHITDLKENLLTIIGFDGYVYLNVNKDNINSTFVAHTTTSNCKFTLPKINSNETLVQKDLGEVICT